MCENIYRIPEQDKLHWQFAPALLENMEKLRKRKEKKIFDMKKAMQNILSWHEI